MQITAPEVRATGPEERQVPAASAGLQTPPLLPEAAWLSLAFSAACPSLRRVRAGAQQEQ